MTIWITRSEASSIMFGGLERLFIWFRKPTYYCEIITAKDRDTPFGDLSESEHPYYKKVGWDNRSSGMWLGHSISFGKVFGYVDEENPHSDIALFVWEKLKEHFNNEPFEKWDDMERAGIVWVEDFLLEIDLDIKLQHHGKAEDR